MVGNLSICLVSMLGLMSLSLFNFLWGLKMLLKEFTYMIEWEIVNIFGTSVEMVILLDWMSLIFMSFVLLISSLVIYYSEEYMSGDEDINRFIMLVLMFVFSMMMLIVSPNLISILLGWDGLGLVSYCLVIYYQNVKSYNAGMLTALSNRIGDVAILLAITWLFNYGGFNYIFYMELVKLEGPMVIVSMLIVLAAMTKSAQIPFSAWLPAAMAAPTPVSALVHSSTLVTAGVYLLIRFNLLIVDTFSSKILLLLAGLTMFMSGLGANYEYDLKKIIALSTLSQLGLMMSILAMGFPSLAYFHLLTHALFKALLFMCAGAVIHNMKDSQDIRNMGALVGGMPMTVACLSVANLALCGTPFLSGFYSKDLILELMSMNYVNGFTYFLYYFSTGLTVCYSMRLVMYTLSGLFNESVCHPVNDEGHLMLRGMSGLLIMSVIGGSMLMWILFPTPAMICLPLNLKLMTIFVSLIGGWVGYIVFQSSVGMESLSLNYHFMVEILGSMWFMPFLSTNGVTHLPLSVGGVSMKLGDMGWLEYFGPQMVYKSVKNASLIYYWFSNNMFKMFLMTMFIMLILLLLYIM
uniref:NADH-ubiquinone oxidoreductase chain 5 n=1 Tax=Caenis robusta TaxID=446426 RepID=A0A7D6ZVB7_9INSE|nr:NADH dehydrogenase subunit 5 [Caenis robusta]UJG45443.1 NADH dehydrogenase subunit 5 [Caenis robusta]